MNEQGKITSEGKTDATGPSIQKIRVNPDSGPVAAAASRRLCRREEGRARAAASGAGRGLTTGGGAGRRGHHAPGRKGGAGC